MYIAIFTAIGACPCLAYLVTTLGSAEATSSALTVLLQVTATTALGGLVVQLLAWRSRREQGGFERTKLRLDGDGDGDGDGEERCAPGRGPGVSG